MKIVFYQSNFPCLMLFLPGLDYIKKWNLNSILQELSFVRNYEIFCISLKNLLL